MGRIALLSILSLTFLNTFTYGMDCSFGSSSNFVEKMIKSCPRPFIDSDDKSYCCIDVQHESYYCCDAEEFAYKTGLGIIVPAIIAVVVIISLIVCCISCLCCTCCPWYRRRHRGTVYGNLQTPPPTSVHIIQPSHYPTAYSNGQQPQAYSIAPPVNVQPQYPAAAHPPPQYIQEGYTKQAPYNPNYVQ